MTLQYLCLVGFWYHISEDWTKSVSFMKRHQFLLDGINYHVVEHFQTTGHSELGHAIINWRQIVVGVDDLLE